MLSHKMEVDLNVLGMVMEDIIASNLEDTLTQPNGIGSVIGTARSVRSHLRQTISTVVLATALYSVQ